MLKALPPTVELAKAYGRLSEAAFQSGHLTQALGWERRALALSEELGDQSTVVQARLMLSLTGPDGGVDEMNRVLEEAQRAGPRRGWQAHAYVWVMDHGISARRYDLAAHAFESGIEYCSDHGLELLRHYLLAYQARLSLCRGQWARAETMADSVLRIPRTSISPRIIALVVLALVRARQGDPGHRNLLDEAQALAEPTRELERVGPVAAARAEVAWLARDAASAASATELAWHLPLESRPDMADELAVWRQRAGLGRRTAEEPRGSARFGADRAARGGVQALGGSGLPV